MLTKFVQILRRNKPISVELSEPPKGDWTHGYVPSCADCVHSSTRLIKGYSKKEAEAKGFLICEKGNSLASEYTYYDVYCDHERSREHSYRDKTIECCGVEGKFFEREEITNSENYNFQFNPPLLGAWMM